MQCVYIQKTGATYILKKSLCGGAEKLSRCRRYHEIKVLCGAVILVSMFFGIKTGERAEVSADGLDIVRETAVTEQKYNTEQPKIAITFDDGPSGACTGKLLDGLKERNVKATFFLIGECARENPGIVKRIYEEGHVIGNHTYHHVDITRLSDEEAAYEINETDKAVYSITGEHIRYVRPPFGAWQKDLELEMEVLPVMWTVDPLDWTTENVDEIVNKVVTEAKEGDIILLHDCYDSSVNAALRIVDILTKEGYEFVTVDDMILD